MMGTSKAHFPPYELLDGWELRATDATHRLERLYHQTQARSWDPRAVLDELEAKHGGIHVPEGKREAMGHVFTVILWASSPPGTSPPIRRGRFPTSTPRWPPPDRSSTRPGTSPFCATTSRERKSRCRP